MEWLIVLVVILIVIALGLGRRLTQPAKARRRRGVPISPLDRERAEEEIRRRHGGSGGTVDGGQHLG